MKTLSFFVAYIDGRSALIFKFIRLARLIFESDSVAVCGNSRFHRKGTTEIRSVNFGVVADEKGLQILYKMCFLMFTKI